MMKNAKPEPGQSRPRTIADYIAAAPKESRQQLREMYRAVRSGAPDAQEALKWSMPAFSERRILVTFAAFKHHIGFYPTPSAVRAFAKELKPYKFATGSIQFPLDRPLPVALIKKITAFRVKERRTDDVKWKSNTKRRSAG